MHKKTIVTLIGTRPELIRLSVIIRKLDEISTVKHILVYTNQNFSYNLSSIFFEELKIRNPDYYFKNKGNTLGRFLSDAIIQFEEVILKEKPNKLLVLGDTNSGLLSIIANKYNIPIIHCEAGNRCFDSRVPEEINRKIIDNVSTYNLPYTDNSKQNLLNEGFHKNYVFKTGNPIREVLTYYKEEIGNSTILEQLDLQPSEYVLVTAHRAENVDNVKSLSSIVKAINHISKDYTVVVSVHPRTKDKLTAFQLTFNEDNVILSEPFGFFDFVNLERHAKVVISDSGTVQEECCLFNIPSITIRESTERQETVECGSNILAGTSYDSITTIFKTIINRDSFWEYPKDYDVSNVSDIVINILLGK